MDDREKYKKRVEAEEELAKASREKRKNKKKSEILNNQLEAEKPKEYSTGLITWKIKDNLLVWHGYIKEEKCFKINHGIYKYSLTVYIDTVDKKDKNLKTAFELQKLQLVAEKIAKKILTKIEEKEKK